VRSFETGARFANTLACDQLGTFSHFVTEAYLPMKYSVLGTRIVRGVPNSYIVDVAVLELHSSSN
jgi:hypothetical protein